MIPRNTLLAQPTRNESQAQTSKFTGKGENKNDKILALKLKNDT